MKVIGVVGLPASGKGEFSRIAREVGIPVIVMGDVIRAAVKKAGLPESDANMGAVATGLRQKQGMDAIARLCVPEIEKQDSPLVVVDGIRGDAEVSFFRKSFPDFVLVGIEAGFDIRMSRLSARGRADATCGPDELRERDRRETGWGLGKAFAVADYVIRNDSGLPEFGEAVRDLIRKLGEGT